MAELMSAAATFDTGREVPSPHDPRPENHADEALRLHLAELHDTAQSALNDHRHELAEQQKFHEQEIDRALRVIAACERALDALQPESEKARSLAEQLAEQRQRDPFLTG